MGNRLNLGITVTPLNRFSVENGDVLHAMKCSDTGYSGFGEAYFTTINPKSIKGWKRHHRMTLNLVVILGKVKFVVTDGEEKYAEYILSPHECYSRLTIAPKIWLAFEGVSSAPSIILNLADIVHDSSEYDSRKISDFSFQFS